MSAPVCAGRNGAHTPGPWHDYTDPMSGMIYLTDDAGNTIAMTSPMEDDPEAESANARLIAAAPDMLAVVRDWLEVGNDLKARREIRERARVAIARATVQP